MSDFKQTVALFIIHVMPVGTLFPLAATITRIVSAPFMKKKKSRKGLMFTISFVYDCITSTVISQKGYRKARFH